jgi:MinD-like ATPase involved in chromosome partitioning or flagellar assembly
MIKIGFSFIKGGTGKTVLATSTVLYMAAAVAAAGLVDASPVPVAARLMAVDAAEGVHAGREEVPVAVVRSPDRIEEGLRAFEEMRLDAAVIDLPPMAKTPRLDVAVVVTDPPGLEFLPEFKADAKYTILVLNMAEEKTGVKYKDAAAAVALPYSPVVARAFIRRIPPVLAHSPKAPRHGEWRRQFFKLMSQLENIVKKEVRR